MTGGAAGDDPFERLLRATAAAEDRHAWFQGTRAVGESLVRAAVGARRDLVVLDLGCGTGRNLAWLAEFGSTTGFERSPYGVATARARGFRIEQGDLAAPLPFPDGAFDLVTALDVLYALDGGEESRALAEAARILRPGGVAVVSTAAFPWLTGPHSRLALERRRHDPATLAEALRTAGFGVERITCSNAVTLPLVFAARLGARAAEGLGARRWEEAEIAVPPAGVNRVIAALLRAEAWWVGRWDLGVGSTVWGVGKKG